MDNQTLELIQKCVIERKILWSYHVNMRLRDRFIRREWILDSHQNYEIIEKYFDDKPLPSFLIKSSYNGIVMHILFALDIEDEMLTVVTAYKPSPELWESDFATRRKK